MFLQVLRSITAYAAQSLMSWCKRCAESALFGAKDGELEDEKYLVSRAGRYGQNQITICFMEYLDIDILTIL